MVTLWPNDNSVVLRLLLRREVRTLREKFNLTKTIITSWTSVFPARSNTVVSEIINELNNLFVYSLG